MPSFDSYNPQSTSVSYPWPAEINGVERIALSATGNLQRVLSAFFARPITISLVYSNTSHFSTPNSSLESPITHISPELIARASHTTPIVQRRQVHLQCNGHIVCTATSTVRMTAPRTAHLFLVEKYAIGQMFRVLERVPAFELCQVGLGPVVTDADAEAKKGAGFAVGKGAESDAHVGQLWRTYSLTVPDFECEILEVFSHREMFLGAERWLASQAGSKVKANGIAIPELAVFTGPRGSDRSSPTLSEGLIFVFTVGFILLVLFEASFYLSTQSHSHC